MNAVEVRNLSFNYKGAFVFDNTNFNIKKGSFITIIGRGGSGKSTLFKIFTGDLKYDGSIMILDKSIQTSLENGTLGFVSPDFILKKEVVIDELIENLKYKRMDFYKIESDIRRISKKIGIYNILNKRVIDLSIKEKILVIFALQCLLKPKVLVIDNCFSFLDLEKDILVKEVKRIFKKCTIINISNDVNDCLFGQEVLFLSDNLVKKDVHVLDSDDFLSNKLDVPFMILLSERLKFYGLTNKIYLDVERLIDDLWE